MTDASKKSENKKFPQPPKLGGMSLSERLRAKANQNIERDLANLEKSVEEQKHQPKPRFKLKKS